MKESFCVYLFCMNLFVVIFADIQPPPPPTQTPIVGM